jgi:hypothetical protein
MCAIFAMPCFYTAEASGRTVCTGFTSVGVVSRMLLWMDTAVFRVIPLAFITYWNLRIYYKVRHRNQELADENSNQQMPQSTQSTNSQDSGSHKNAKTKGLQFNKVDKKLRKMAMAISLAYIAFSLPLPLRYLFVAYNKTSGLSWQAVRFLAYHISSKLFLMNHAINFYLYCLSGTKFRNDFIDLVRKPFRWLGEK